MANWAEFVAGAPQVSETFLRRHAATGGLCMLATLRSDGFPPGGSSVEVGGGHLDIRIWKPGEPERVVREH